MKLRNLEDLPHKRLFRVLDSVSSSIPIIQCDVSKPSRLSGEAQVYCEAMTDRLAERLKSLGVDPVAVQAGILGIASAEILKGGMWAPCEGASKLLTVLVEEQGALIDILAFDPHTPAKWSLRKGDAWALGLDAIDKARGSFRKEERDLRLHQTPMDWLQNGMTGACVLRWSNNAQAVMIDCPYILVGRPKDAQALRAILSRPPRLPEIKCVTGGQGDV